jgi:phosphomannomutase
MNCDVLARNTVAVRTMFRHDVPNDSRGNTVNPPGVVIAFDHRGSEKRFARRFRPVKRFHP